jgi:hypothetical protein
VRGEGEGGLSGEFVFYRGHRRMKGCAMSRITAVE